MKTAISTTPHENIKSKPYKTKPDIRDDLDSRVNEEQEFKGDNVTHNTKPHHNKKPAKKEGK